MTDHTDSVVRLAAVLMSLWTGFIMWHLGRIAKALEVLAGLK